MMMFSAHERPLDPIRKKHTHCVSVSLKDQPKESTNVDSPDRFARRTLLQLEHLSETKQKSLTFHEILVV